jgi:hypothetical protein
MGSDIEGNVYSVGDYVYTAEAARAGSNSKRLLRCEVLSFTSTGGKVRLKVLETGREISKVASNVVVPKG